MYARRPLHWRATVHFQRCRSISANASLPPPPPRAGGCNQDGAAIDVFEAYDFASRRWTTLPSPPHKRAASTGAVVRENKLILVGGVNEKQVPLKQVDVFDTEAQTWSRLPNLPIGVVGPVVKLVDDKLYVIGGTNKKEPPCNQSVVFDFDRKEWFPLPRKPTPCYSCSGYVFGKKLYVVGGRSGQTPVKELAAFDLETQQWERLDDMTANRVFYNVVGIGEEILVIGGLVPMIGICKIVERYNIREGKWTRLRDLAEIRSDGAHGVVGGRVVVAGGLGGTELKAMDTVESIGLRGKRFSRLPSLPKPRSSMTSLEFEGKLAAINGVGDGGPQKIIDILSKRPVERKEKDKNA